MKVDLREKIKNERMMRALPNNHRKLFEEKLQKDLHSKPILNFGFLKIAASVLILIALSFGGYQIFGPDVSNEVVQSEDRSKKEINSLADISPDLEKVEKFYLSRINYQISKIKITDENKDLLEVYFSQLGLLQQEYDTLNGKLNGGEINEETIDALIENLQLRLQLLRQLKKKLQLIENLIVQQNESNQV